MRDEEATLWDKYFFLSRYIIHLIFHPQNFFLLRSKLCAQVEDEVYWKKFTWKSHKLSFPINFQLFSETGEKFIIPKCYQIKWMSGISQARTYIFFVELMSHKNDDLLRYRVDNTDRDLTTSPKICAKKIFSTTLFTVHPKLVQFSRKWGLELFFLVCFVFCVMLT